MAIILLPAYFRFRKHENSRSRANKHNSEQKNLRHGVSFDYWFKTAPMRDANDAYLRKTRWVNMKMIEFVLLAVGAVQGFF